MSRGESCHANRPAIGKILHASSQRLKQQVNEEGVQQMTIQIALPYLTEIKEPLNVTL